jgi:phosphate-selective porin OprO/OprP
MLLHPRHALVVLAISAFGIRVSAQHAPIDVSFDPNKGLIFEKDSTFRAVLRFRMQDRFAMFSTDGDDLQPARSDIRVRRFRLRFDGYILTRRLRYTLHMGFSKADLDLEANTTPQPIRDAILHYDLSKRVTISMGQQKLPGNRQQVVASNNLQLVDRSIVTSAFTLDRDFGLWLTWKPVRGDQRLTLKGAITSGEGRNASPGDGKLCYTGRAEWEPLGNFANDGDYSEGDLANEPKPKLAIGVTYSGDDGARRSGAQLGKVLFAGRTINTFITDMVLKYHGWALSSEFARRESEQDPFTSDPLNPATTVGVYEGWGSCTQLSKMFAAKNEVVARYARVTPGERMGAEVDKEEAWLGYNRYLNGHRIKLQGDISYSWTDNHAAFDHAGNVWGLWLQIELGI